jgi:hypothetical protein
MAWWWIASAIAALFVVGAVAYSAIRRWVASNWRPTTSHAELIKEQLSNGQYRVVGGVFDISGVQTASQAWDADELDAELRQQFGSRTRIRIHHP